MRRSCAVLICLTQQPFARKVSFLFSQIGWLSQSFPTDVEIILKKVTSGIQNGDTANQCSALALQIH